MGKIEKDSAKNKKVITRDEIIKESAREAFEIFNVRTRADAYRIMGILYDTIEGVVFNKLSNASEEEDICVKLFNGVSITSKYVPKRFFDSNLTGRTFAKDKIKVETKVTRQYTESLKHEFDIKHSE